MSSSSSAEASSNSRVVIALGALGEILCADDVFMGPSVCDKWDNGSAMFCPPGKYFTLNLYGCNRKIHRSIRAHGLDLLE